VNGQPGNGPDTLLFGIGNSGRSDDGLGWAFLDQIQQDPGFACRIEYRYQLQVEDAALTSSAERVIFIDSHKGNLPGGFAWKPCKPANDFEFTSHVLPPRAVMYFCQDLYGKTPRADLLMIQGSSWDLRIGMSPEAEQHLEKALRFFRTKLSANNRPVS
jgi:hydrogenase maturation protease